MGKNITSIQKHDSRKISTYEQALGRRILRTGDAAYKLGLKPCTLEKWRSTGEGPAWVRLSSRAVGYFDDVLDEWLSERTYQSICEVNNASK